VAFNPASESQATDVTRRLRPGTELRAPSRVRQGGFTLLEIVVVMVIIAAAAVLGVMALTGGSERVQLHASTKQIAANLRYTRAQAIATGLPQRFTIDPRGHAWQAPNGRHGKVPEALGIHFTGARQAQPQADVGAILFFDDGASTGGRVQIAGKRAAWNVDVAWLTGEVSLHRAGATQ
jgi:general secretion pathway protein H